MVRVIFRLRGRVQGVGYRDHVCERAHRYAIAGSVRNAAGEAALVIDVEGEPVEVERFLADVLANGPAAARVDSVERSPAAPLGRKAFQREPST